MRNVPSSIRLFHLCSGMKWAHLPVAGGIYDQSPDLLDQWAVMFELQAKRQERDMADMKRKNQNTNKRR